jgi:hypothetical protein
VTAAGSVTGGFVHSTGTLQVDGQANLSQTLQVGPSGGYARIDGVGTYNVSGSWLTFSAREVKQGIAPYRAGLDAVLALNPVQYRYRKELFGPEEAEKVRYGLVADEVAPVVPEMVGDAVFGGRHLSTLSMGHLASSSSRPARRCRHKMPRWRPASQLWRKTVSDYGMMREQIRVAAGRIAPQ